MSSLIEPHVKHTNADTMYATQKLAEGYTRDQVVTMLQSERQLGAKGAVTCVRQILWTQAKGNKDIENELTDWSHTETLKILREPEQIRRAAQILVNLSKNSTAGKKGGKQTRKSKNTKKNKKNKKGTRK